MATNSITQGEQVGQLWPILFGEKISVNFVRTSFKWTSDAKGTAGVHVVILGLGKNPGMERVIFDEDQENITKKHISPYLVTTNDPSTVVMESSKPLNELPEMAMGSKPIDGGNYIFDDDEREEFLSKEPGAGVFLRPYVNAKEFLNNKRRWILSLHDVSPDQYRRMPRVMERIKKVKNFRIKSKSKSTRKLAETPTLYHLNVLPDRPFLLIPRVSSERRHYVPIGFLEPPCIPSDATLVVQNASLGLFGLVTSRMHMAWLRGVGGRLESRLRYSAGIVYNTFPAPKAYETLEPFAQEILDVRGKYPDSSLADLYDPDTMPSDLLRAHARLDRAVEKLYRSEPFGSDSDRLEFLLERYVEMITENQDKMA